MITDRSPPTMYSIFKDRIALCGWLACALIIMAFAVLFTTRLAQADSLRFAIERYEVVGNSLIANDEIQSLVSPFTGPNRQLADIQAAAKNVENSYHAQGWGAVKVVVPSQKLNAGVVQLQVIEPPLSTILVSGNKHFSERNIRRSLPNFATGKTPNTEELKAAIEDANTHPDKKLNVIFRQAEEPGAIEALIDVKDQSPSKWTLGVDNYSTDADAEIRTGVSYSHSNVFDRDHQARINVTVLPEKPDEFASVVGSYVIPFKESGDKLTLFGGASFTDGGEIGGGIIDVEGEGYVAGANYRRRLNDVKIGNSTLEHGINAGITYKHVAPNVQFLGQGPSLVPSVSIAPITIGYDARLRSESGRDTSALIGLTTNFIGDADDIEETRAGAGVTFNILRGQIKHIEPLPGNWALAGTLRGQYADSPLVPLEQTGIGGLNSLRALSPRQFSDDNSYAAVLELYSPNFGRSIAEGLSMRGSVFFERAALIRNDPQALERDELHMADIGVGLTVDYNKWLRLRFDLAWLVADGGLEELDDVRANISLEADIRN